MGMTDEEIYLKYRDELIRYAAALIGPSDAEDVLSSVLTRLYRSRRSLADIESARPYLMKSVLNESMNRRKRAPSLPLRDIAVEPVRSHPEVLHAVTALPTRQRAATYLTFWCGLNSGEAGELMGCRPATVRRYVHLAKRRLAEVLNDDE
jgi:RNA polymerase sigma-70 factor (ECF subfamily)